MVEKKLDSLRELTYIYFMIVMNLLSLKQVGKAAWRHTAVAEGGFY
jgi:hypothetical protein